MGYPAALCASALAVVIGCGSTVTTVVADDDGSGASSQGGSDGGNGTGGAAGGAGASYPDLQSDKVDLLFVVDNSRGMRDKQALLAATIPDLLTALFDTGVRDVHIGVISSSIGTHGADSCTGQSFSIENDQAHLLTRSEGGAPGSVPTYEGLGFLVWDPDPANPSHAPPGENNAGAITAGLEALVLGAGQAGCGFEAPLEAWYRFLVDPNPYASITVTNGVATPSGTDTTLLSQRQRFLRADSLLSIVVVSDENDCSFRAGGQFFFAAQIYAPGTTQPYRLPKPRPECATNPNDPCCRSCAQSQDGCPVAPSCDANNDGKPDTLSNLDDAINVRCFDQKRRFGIDFLQPIDRYRDALTLSQVADYAGNVQQNPLFSDLDPSDRHSDIRNPSLVVYTAVVGVPWQLVMRNGNPADGVMTAAEFGGSWSNVIGDPQNHVPAGDPHMVESIDVRPGLPTPSQPLADPIHGHDNPHPQRDDLQHVCVFDLPTPVDCNDAGNDFCACKGTPVEQTPLCYDPATAAFTNVQRRAGAVPGIRQLWLARELSKRAVAGSICPVSSTDPASPGYAFRPTAATLVEVMAERLTP
jgi:hypothetical protein